MSTTPPGLITFDIFGTVIDWRRGLTTVLVTRPHHRPATADVTVADLAALATLLDPAP